MDVSHVSKRPAVNKTVSLRRVLLMKGGSDRSEPIYDLARELNDLGVNVHVVDQALSAYTLKWLYFARRSGAFVFVRYHNSDDKFFFQRQLYRAKLLGCTVVRWWVGSDVLYSRESEQTLRVARAIDGAVDLNITVSPHLVTELGEIGIEAEYVPSFCDVGNSHNDPPSRLPKGVLSYLPTKRKAFYGQEILITAIEDNPDLEFFIVGDESHSLQHYSNVTSLGWVEDMNDVWPRVGVLLRVTQHDGMPRMVLEALARYRYVIYSETFEGCWFGRSKEQVRQYLKTFKSLDKPNISGPTVTYSSTNAATTFADKVAKRLKTPFSVQRFKNSISAYRQLV